MIQKELAETLNVSEATISRVLSGERRPSVHLMQQVRDWTDGAWTIDMQVKALNANPDVVANCYGGILRAWMSNTPR